MKRMKGLLRSVWRNGYIDSTLFKSPRSYSTELNPEISTDLIRIMEKRLSAIEHRNTVLQTFMNQPDASPAEYSRANKELRKIRSSMELITQLRAKQKDIDGLKSVIVECPED